VPLLPNADAGSTTPQTTVCLTPPRGFVWTSGVGTAGGDFLSWFTVG
jgi:hypothetical protein